MRTARTLFVVLLILLAPSTGAASVLTASQDQTALPNTLVGRWTRTVTHAAWLKHGRDFPTTKVRIEVDKTGRQVGYFGPDFPPVPPSSTGRATYPDWYTDWKVAGGKLTIGAVPPCGWDDSWSGGYRWTASARTLTIRKVSDKCHDRVAIFAGTWKKAG